MTLIRNGDAARDRRPVADLTAKKCRPTAGDDGAGEEWPREQDDRATALPAALLPNATAAGEKVKAVVVVVVDHAAASTAASTTDSEEEYIVARRCISSFPLRGTYVDDAQACSAAAVSFSVALLRPQHRT